MVTWSDARGKVRGDLWRSSSGVPDDVCDRGLHSAIIELEAERRWLWLEDLNDSSAVEAETDEVAAPATLSSIQSLCYRRGAGQTLDPPLDRITLGQLRVMSSGPRTMGAPSAYALSEGTFYFDCLLPIGSSLELVYTARTPEDLAAAVAAGDTNRTLQKAQSAVIAGACAYVALTYLKNEAEADRQQKAFDKHLERLCDQEDEARGDLTGGLIQPDTSYHDEARGI